MRNGTGPVPCIGNLLHKEAPQELLLLLLLARNKDKPFSSSVTH